VICSEKGERVNLTLRMHTFKLRECIPGACYRPPTTILLQLRVLRFGSLQYGDIGVSLFLRAAYTTTAETRFSGFTGASTIKAIPMMTSTADPTSSVRWIRLRNTCTAISAACAKLDHAVKAIRLRFAEMGHGLPAARKYRV
jgi:hypothetical protein